jgi:hypothetical protein
MTTGMRRRIPGTLSSCSAARCPTRVLEKLALTGNTCVDIIVFWPGAPVWMRSTWRAWPSGRRAALPSTTLSSARMVSLSTLCASRAFLSSLPRFMYPDERRPKDGRPTNRSCRGGGREEMLFLVLNRTALCWGSGGVVAAMRRSTRKVISAGRIGKAGSSKAKPPPLDTKSLPSYSVDQLSSPEVRSLPPSPPAQSWCEGEVGDRGTLAASNRMHEMGMQARRRGDSVTRGICLSCLLAGSRGRRCTGPHAWCGINSLQPSTSGGLGQGLVRLHSRGGSHGTLAGSR